MPRYYCDYCDTYLTHDSPSVRKQHNSGYKHKANVRTYYQQFEEQQTQSLIDQRIKEHLGQTAAFQQVGAAYNQHLASMPRPRIPMLPMPVMPVMGASQGLMNSPLVPGIRPPVLPRPVGPPGGYAGPPMQSMAPPGAPSMPMQFNGLPRPPTINAPTSAPGSTPSSNGTPTMSAPPMYQPNSAAPTSGGYDSYNINASSGFQMPASGGSAAPPSNAGSRAAPPSNAGSQDEFPYGQASETAH